jgi:hypothetical protein
LTDPARGLVFALLSRGAVRPGEIADEQVRFVGAGHRSTAFKVLRDEPGRSHLVKLADGFGGSGFPAEDDFYRRVAAEPALAPVLNLLSPALSGVGGGVLGLELLAGAQTLDDLFRAAGRFEAGALDAAGAALGTLHRFGRQLLACVAAPNLLPWAFDLRGTFGEGAARARASDRAVLAVIARDPELSRLLDALHPHWQPAGLIHGDMKWDHLLLEPGGVRAVKIIDWETAQEGDPAWDLAGIVQDFARAWIHSMPTGGASPDDPAGRALYPAEQVRADLGRFWRAYARAAEPPDPPALLARAVRFTGARLLETILQQQRDAHALTRHSVLMLELCRNVMRDPHAAVAALVGA